MLNEFFKDFKNRVSIFKVKLSNIFYKPVAPQPTTNSTSIDFAKDHLRIETLYEIRGFVVTIRILLESQDYVGPVARQLYETRFYEYTKYLLTGDDFYDKHPDFTLTLLKKQVEKGLGETLDLFNNYCQNQSLHKGTENLISKENVSSDELANLNLALQAERTKQKEKLEEINAANDVLRQKVNNLTMDNANLNQQLNDLKSLNNKLSTYSQSKENEKLCASSTSRH